MGAYFFFRSDSSSAACSYQGVLSGMVLFRFRVSRRWRMSGFSRMSVSQRVLRSRTLFFFLLGDPRHDPWRVARATELCSGLPHTRLAEAGEAQYSEGDQLS